MRILILLCVVSIMAQQVVANCIVCYECEHNPNVTNYDPWCGNYHYHNGNLINKAEKPGASCAIRISKDGVIDRYLAIGKSYSEGDCYYGNSNSTTCYCTEDLCNTGSLCEHCFPSTTPEPFTFSVATQLPGQSDHNTGPSTSSIAIKVHSERSSSDNTTGSPVPLNCFSCIGCSTVDKSTPVAVDKEYKSCVTKVNLENHEVVRAASLDENINGECKEDLHFLSCYCNTNLCNHE